MIEDEIERQMKKEISGFTYVDPADVACFLEHRVRPIAVRLCLDTKGVGWCGCYLVTDHSGSNDSPYRAAYDPAYKSFVREITLDNGVAHYVGRYPDLESLVDGFA